MAGYVLSTLINTPTHVKAQDDNVIDEIVCKKLKIVNDKGITVAELSNTLTGGELTLTALHLGNTNVKMSWSDLTFTFNGVKQNRLWLMGADIFGGLSIYNADGKKLVGIGSMEGRPNDGLINIYDHRGEWRTFSTDGVSRKE